MGGANLDFIEIALEPLAPPVHRRGLLLYAPFFDANLRLVEIACDAEPDGEARALYAVLDRAGFAPVFSRPGRSLALNEVCAAFVAPLVAFVLGGRSPIDVHATLRDFGFVRPLGALIRAMGVPLGTAPSDRGLSPEPGRLAGMLEDILPGSPTLRRIQAGLDAITASTFEGGVVDEDLLDAVLTSLLELSIRMQDERIVVHPSVIDVMAREVLDFPLGHGSLCRYLTGGVATQILSRRSRFAHLVPLEGTARSERFIDSGRRFYQPRSQASPPASSERGARVVPPARRSGGDV